MMTSEIWLVSLLFLVSAFLKSKFTWYNKIAFANELSGKEKVEKMLLEDGIMM